TVDQVLQLPVGGKSSAVDAPPSTVTVTGRSAVDPLAYRKLSTTVPAVVRLTPDHSTKAPVTLGVLTNPVPLNPGWLVSTVLPGERVASSASSRVAPGGP